MPSYVEVNPRSLLIRVEDRSFVKRKSKPKKRSEVACFSRQSCKRLCRLLLNNVGAFPLFFTVTFRRNERSCRKSKEFLNRFLTRFRQSCGSETKYLWVLEFQSRGAVHFHFFFENFSVKYFREWQSLSVRRKVLKQFKGDPENLERYKFLTYLWLKTTGQLNDSEAVKASCTLLKIYSEGFAAKYVANYMKKKEQKIFIGDVDESTGEILDMWQGRYWGASRKLKNEKLYYSMNHKAVRIFRKWHKRNFPSKFPVGLRLLFNEEERKRVMMVCDHLDLAKYSRDDEQVFERLAEFRHALQSVEKDKMVTLIGRINSER